MKIYRYCGALFSLLDLRRDKLESWSFEFDCLGELVSHEVKVLQVLNIVTYQELMKFRYRL